MTIALALIGMLYLGLFLGVLVMSICAAAGRADDRDCEAELRKLRALQRAEQPRPEQCEGIADDEHVITLVDWAGSYERSRRP